MSMETVAIIVISEKILQSKKSDSTSKFLVKELTSLGYSVGKITVILDKESVIVHELDSLITNFDIVIAVGERCGNIFKAIGRMISQELESSDELERILNETREVYDIEEVFLPIQAKILQNNQVFPVVHFQRVFILKEMHVKQSFNKILKKHLVEYRSERCLRKTIEITLNGNSVNDVKEIREVSNNLVKVELNTNDQCYVLNVSSEEMVDLVDFTLQIQNKFDSYRLKLVDTSDIWEKVYSSNEKHVRQAIENIEQCLAQYGLDNIFVSFNGGKDCTVLLHLVLTVIRIKYPHYTKPILCHYVQSESPFPEQDEFISLSECYYNLKIMTIRSGIKDALQQTLSTYPNYKACFMGTRRTDPYSANLDVFQMTDLNWPQIMRVSPLLDWHYSDIWDYLLFYKVPYCKLYDMGYTSLGNTVNTTKNPSLLVFDPFEDKEVYLPAYKLLKENKERNGRSSS